MSSHLVRVSIKCSRCGIDTYRTDIAKSEMGKLVVNSSFVCPNCSLALEAYGPELFEETRKAFYLLEGKWSLHIADLGKHRLEALRVLHSILGGSPAELIEVVRDRSPLVEGTLVEVERVEELLARVGVLLVKSRLTMQEDES